MVPDSRCVPISPLWRPLYRGCKQIAHVLGNDCDIVFISLKSTKKRAMGNFGMFILLHWYCHRGFGCGKMITFTLKIFNIFGDVYTRDGTISLCQRDASAQIVVSHNYRTQVLGSIPFTPSVVTKWHDRHRYLSIHHVPYLMSLSSPRHCSKTLKTLQCILIQRIILKLYDMWQFVFN